MPLQQCQTEGRTGWRWGQRGKCYTGPDAKRKAIRQGVAIEPGKFVRNRTQIVPSNPLKADPTRTTTLRRIFSTDVSRRFYLLKGKILRLIVDEDALGLRRYVSPLTTHKERDDEKRLRGLVCGSGCLDNSIGSAAFRGSSGDIPSVDGEIVLHTRWAFHTNPQKVVQFQAWLAAQVRMDILDGATTAVDEAYWSRYVEEGYRKGAGRAFDDTRKAALWTGEEAAFYQGTKEEFLRSAFARPVAVEKVKLLAGRVFTDLKGVTEVMSAKITRNLTDGLVQGMNPTEIARNMIRDGIGTKVRGVQSRALTIARTETIRAHAEGQLDAMERLGVTEVGVMVEWSTAGDDRVCELCSALDGVVMKVKEARGIIPRHPNCRCAHIPANVGESTKGQVRSKEEVQKSINDSIRAEMPKVKKRTLAEQKKRSSWAGADKMIAKTRPKGPVAPPARVPTPVRKPKPKPVKAIPTKPKRVVKSFDSLDARERMSLLQSRDKQDKLVRLLKETGEVKFKRDFFHHIRKGEDTAVAFKRWQGLMQSSVKDVESRLAKVVGMPSRAVKVRKVAPRPPGVIYKTTNFFDEKAAARAPLDTGVPYKFRKNQPLRIYHVTSKEAAREIQREGFKASARNQFQGFESEIQGTYGWTDLDRAKFEISRISSSLTSSADEAAEMADGFVIIEVKVPKSRFKDLRPDEDFSLNPADWKASMEEVKSVAVKGDLPPESIRTIFVSEPL